MKDKTADTTGNEQISAHATSEDAPSGDGLKVYLEELREKVKISNLESEVFKETLKVQEEVLKILNELVDLDDPEERKEKRKALSIADKKLEELKTEEVELKAKYEEIEIQYPTSSAVQPSTGRGFKRKHRQSMRCDSSTSQPNQNDIIQLEQEAGSLGFRHIAPKPVGVIDSSPSIQNTENATDLQPISDAPILPTLNEILEENMPASLYALPTLQPLQAHPPIHDYFNKLREDLSSAVAEANGSMAEHLLSEVDDNQENLSPPRKKARN